MSNKNKKTKNKKAFNKKQKKKVQKSISKAVDLNFIINSSLVVHKNDQTLKTILKNLWRELDATHGNGIYRNLTSVTSLFATVAEFYGLHKDKMQRVVDKKEISEMNISNYKLDIFDLKDQNKLLLENQKTYSNELSVKSSNQKLRKINDIKIKIKKNEIKIREIEIKIKNENSNKEYIYYSISKDGGIYVDAPMQLMKKNKALMDQLKEFGLTPKSLQDFMDWQNEISQPIIKLEEQPVKEESESKTKKTTEGWMND